MCWIGHGEVLPQDVPANARRTIYIARVNQNHFVPLRRSRKRGGEIPLSYTPSFEKKGHLETSIAEVPKRKQENITQITTASKCMKELYVAEEICPRATSTAQDTGAAQDKKICRQATSTTLDTGAAQGINDSTDSSTKVQMNSEENVDYSKSACSSDCITPRTHCNTANAYTAERNNRLNFLHLCGVSTVEGPYDKSNVTQDAGAAPMKTTVSDDCKDVQTKSTDLRTQTPHSHAANLHIAEGNESLDFLDLCDIFTERKYETKEATQNTGAAQIKTGVSDNNDNVQTKSTDLSVTEKI